MKLFNPNELFTKTQKNPNWLKLLSNDYKEDFKNCSAEVIKQFLEKKIQQISQQKQEA